MSDDEGFLTDPVEIGMRLTAEGWALKDGMWVSPEACDDPACNMHVIDEADVYGVSEDGHTFRIIRNRRESEVRKEALYARWGRPKASSLAQKVWLLGRLGLRAEVHPRDVAAFLYSSQEAAEAFAASNRAFSDNEPMGVFVDDYDGQVYGVLDLRPQLTGRFGQDPTDPSLPDDWEPPKKENGA